jgi:hypothetical protein
MVQPRNAFSALLRSGIHRGRSLLLAGAALAFCLGSVAAARAGTPPADPPGAAAPENAAPDDAAKVPAVEGSSLPPGAATEVAAVRRPIEAKSQPSGDEQRRVLMLLLMNSAGPVRPFGGLGH